MNRTYLINDLSNRQQLEQFQTQNVSLFFINLIKVFNDQLYQAFLHKFVGSFQNEVLLVIVLISDLIKL